MLFSPFKMLSYISTVMTLLPGDIIFTGSPHGWGPIKSGDEVEIEIENIGILKNFVA
jgi:2-keto-4-pentenoate hydratase/2-oxohepta-3-ene-1,7-dioic acid hydratase in catechol pathway